MAVVQLTANEGTVRAGGFFSRDQAEAAEAELRALFRFLAADGRPSVWTWEASADRLVLRNRSDISNRWTWDDEASTLTGELGGLACVAKSEGRGFALRLGGRALRGDRQPLVDELGVAVGSRDFRLDHSPSARIRGRIVAVDLLRFADGLPFPPNAKVSGSLATGAGSIDLGRGRVSGSGFVFDLVADSPAGGTLKVTTDLTLPDGTDVAVELRIVEETTFRGLTVADRPAVRNGEEIGLVRLGRPPNGSTPPSVRLTFAGIGAVDASIRVVEADGVTYHVPMRIPSELPVPARLRVTAEGQDEPIGELIVAPREVVGRWTMALDERGNARLPKPSLPSLVVADQRIARWSASDDGALRVEAEGVSASAPLDDRRFRPFLLAEPEKALWDSPRVADPEPGRAVAWVPGYPPVDVAIDDAGRVRGPGAAFKELLVEADRRGLCVRIDQRDRRGVIWPARRNLGNAEEISPQGGSFALHGDGSSYVVWFRGMWLDASITTPGESADQRMLELARPLPIEGRLGADLGTFLPLRAWIGPQGGTLVDGDRSLRLERHGDRYRAEGLDYGSRYGFHPHWPKEFDGRYSWRGFVWSADRDGVLFHGWLLDPDFMAGPSGPFAGYGFRPGFATRGPVRVGPGLARPMLPIELDPIVDDMLARGASAPRVVDTPQGPFELVACYDDPRKKPVWVEVEAKSGRAMASLRVFKR